MTMHDSMINDLKIYHLEQLGLVEDPFKQSADPRYLYLGQEHLAAYRQAQLVITRRRGLALITGAPGTGKSSLARRVYDVFNSEDNIHIAYIPRSSFSTKFNAIKLVSQAFPRLEVPTERSYESQLEAFKTEIGRAYQKKQNVVVLLDDAQEMSRVGLNLIHELYNFEYDEKTVQVVVFGQSETLDLFKTHAAVHSRMYVHMILPPLSLPSALQMVMFRLRTAGRSEPLIDDNAFSLMYDITGGLPRDIVNLCSIATEILLESGAKFISLDVMKEAVNIYEQRQ